MISICMAYYNRQELLDRTIKSIKSSVIKDYEIIIVDDASSIPVSCPEAQIITIKQEEKWWHNPCLVYNMAFKQAKGDIIIIQNPECMHYGDVLKYTVDNIVDGLYLSFSCYAINQKETQGLNSGVAINVQDKSFGGKDKNGYYNHPALRPVAYHFCSAITKHDLDLVGGFDENYALGISYDDDDLVYAINDKGITTKIIGYPLVIHQYHQPFTYQKENVFALHERNKQLFKSKWE